MEIIEKKVSVDNLKVDYSYQRKIREYWVKKIIRDYDPALCNQIVLSMRENGDMYIIDGNHTVEATKKVIGDNASLSAKIYIGITVEREAELFHKLNENKKSLTVGELVKSKFTEGQKEIVDYVTLLHVSRIPFEFGAKSHQKQFVGHSMGLKSYRMCGHNRFITALDIFRETSTISGYDAAFLGGIAYLIAHSETDVDTERLKKVINKKPKETIQMMASMHAKGINKGQHHSMKAYAEAFAVLYNAHLSDKNRITIQ